MYKGNGKSFSVRAPWKENRFRAKKCTEILDFMFNVYKRNICLMFLWKWNITFMNHIQLYPKNDFLFFFCFHKKWRSCRINDIWDYIHEWCVFYWINSNSSISYIIPWSRYLYCQKKHKEIRQNYSFIRLTMAVYTKLHEFPIVPQDIDFIGPNQSTKYLEVVCCRCCYAPE